MNADVIRLIRIYLIEIFSLNAFRSKDTKTVLKAVGMLILYLFVGLIIAVYVAVAAVSLEAFGAGESLFAFCALASSVLTLITVTFKSFSFLYDAKDTQMLSAMPLRRRDFILARLIVLYLFELPFNLVLFLPAFAVHAIAAHPPAGFYACFVLGFLFFPLIPFFLGVLFGVLASFISNRFRFAKLIFMGLVLTLTVGFLCLIFYSESAMFSADFSFSSGEFSEAFSGMITSVVGGNFLLSFYQAVFGGNLAVTAAFAVGSVLVSAVVMRILFRNYIRFVGAVQSPERRRAFRREEISSSSPLAALYFREVKRYFASVSYVINTLFGGVLLLVAGIAVFCADLSSVEDALADFSEGGLSLNLAGLVPLAMCFLAGMAPTTTVTLSLEGKTFWLLKTLPVKPSAIYTAKVLLSLTTVLPSILISGILMVIKFQPGIVLSVMIFLLPAVFSVFCAYWGLWLGCRFLKLDWVNETAVIKQNPAVLISVFTVFPLMIFGGTFLFLPEELEAVVFALMCLLFAGLSLLLSWAVNRKPLQKLA